ncbi:MAG: isocitrate/isopropylmalate family dehydrogenase [Pseudomonadota bacterium]
MQNSSFSIAVVEGDGIGPDVIGATIAVMEAARARVGGFELRYENHDAGAGYYAEHGQDMAPGAEDAVQEADAILLGAIGLPAIRAEDGTEIAPHLRLREHMQLYAGVRPVKAYPNAPQKLADPRAAEIDFVVLRESTEGLFYSASVHKRPQIANDDEVQDILRITRPTTEKLHDFAFRLARKRKDRGGRGHVTCVDKANVFRSMAFFREIFDERAKGFPDIEVGYNYVDAQALDLIRRPWEFDVMVMENMFGDILCDLGGGLVGGMGMAACGEIGDSHGLFQPAHGSAPDIAGEDKANPLAAILSGALMLDYLAEKSGAQSLTDASLLIEQAVSEGFRKGRLRPMEFAGDQGTKALTDELLQVITEI